MRKQIFFLTLSLIIPLCVALGKGIKARIKGFLTIQTALCGKIRRIFHLFYEICLKFFHPFFVWFSIINSKAGKSTKKECNSPAAML